MTRTKTGNHMTRTETGNHMTRFETGNHIFACLQTQFSSRMMQILVKWDLRLATIWRDLRLATIWRDLRLATIWRDLRLGTIWRILYGDSTGNPVTGTILFNIISFPATQLHQDFLNPSYPWGKAPWFGYKPIWVFYSTILGGFKVE